MKKFEIHLRRRNIPEEEFLDDLKRVARALNQQTITAAVYDEKGKFGKTTILRRFGSWNKALAASGLKVILTLNNKEEVLFENLADIWQRLGRQPVGKDIEKTNGYSKFSLGAYENRFGSWNKTLQAFSDFINASEAVKECANINTGCGSGHSNRRTLRKINWRLRATILIRDSCICKMCGASTAKDPTVTLHVDHVKPWSKGGETELDNLRTLCSVCNIGKSNVF